MTDSPALTEDGLCVLVDVDGTPAPVPTDEYDALKDRPLGLEIIRDKVRAARAGADADLAARLEGAPPAPDYDEMVAGFPPEDETPDDGGAE